LPALLPQAWHEVAADASEAGITPGAVVLGPAAAGKRSATGVGALSAGQQLTPEWPCLAATTWHSRLQNHTFLHWPQRSSLPSLLPHAWHELAADASEVGITPGAVVLVPAAAGKRSATSVAGVGALSAGQQLAPEWPCLAATT